MSLFLIGFRKYAVSSVIARACPNETEIEIREMAGYA